MVPLFGGHIRLFIEGLVYRKKPISYSVSETYFTHSVFKMKAKIVAVKVSNFLDGSFFERANKNFSEI